MEFNNYKQLINSVIVVNLFCYLLSCNNKNETVIERYENGNPKIINYYIAKNKSDYLQKEFYLNGKVDRTKEFINNKQEGFEYGYYFTGEKAVEIMYKNGERNGITREFYKNGQVSFEGYCYPNSSFSGKTLSFYSSGQLRDSGYRRNNTYAGEFKQFYEDGKIKSIINYDNSNLSKYFDRNGRNISKEEFYKMNN
jgi:antitoxin component YwqK of YwqJK toxin-antitoxin module